MKWQESGKNIVNRLATVEWWMRAPLMSEWRSDSAVHQLQRMHGSLVEPTISRVKSTNHIQLARIPVRLYSDYPLETRTVLKKKIFYFILS